MSTFKQAAVLFLVLFLVGLGIGFFADELWDRIGFLYFGITGLAVGAVFLNALFKSKKSQ